MFKTPENSQSQSVPEEITPDQGLQNLPTAHEKAPDQEDERRSDIETIHTEIVDAVDEVRKAREKLSDLDPDGTMIKAIVSGTANLEDDDVLEAKAQLLIINEGSKVVRSHVQRELELSGKRQEIADEWNNPNRTIHGELKISEQGQAIPPEDLQKQINAKIEKQFQEVVKQQYDKIMENTKLGSPEERKAFQQQELLDKIKRARQALVTRSQELGSDKITPQINQDAEVQEYLTVIDEHSKRIFADVMEEVEAEMNTQSPKEKWTADQVTQQVNRRYNTLMQQTYLE